MKATNSALRQLIEGTKVFAVPLYQRRYSWGRDSWKAFWQSILEQYEYSRLEEPGAVPVTHFIGSFVLAPAPGAASAPTRFVLIDGQQRLTTTMIALAALRDLQAERIAELGEKQALVAKFNTLYLHNTFETDPLKRLRLLPTQQDRADYAACVGKTPAEPSGSIGEAYDYFRSTRAMRGKDFRDEALDLEAIGDVLLSRLTIVEITTEAGDNVHRIFQTLNSAGVKLKQIDLLRNHFFMLLPDRGERLYTEVWREMELRLGESQLDRFFWADLVRRDAKVSRNDVYAAMQQRLEPIAHDEAAVEGELRRLNADSHEYLSIVQRSESVDSLVEARLSDLRKWGSDTARPLILEILVRLREGRISAGDAAACLLIVDSFLVRRMLVGVPTNNLNRIFSSLTPVLARGEITPTTLAEFLSEGQKYWPSDNQVIQALITRPFYFAGQPHQRRLVLERLDDAMSGKEKSTHGDKISIEHVMPQTATESWLAALDPDPVTARHLHEQFVHTLGNLTLTGYNSELGQDSYEEKRAIFVDSGIAMNREIAETYDTWDVAAIESRGAALAETVVLVWPGPTSSQIDVSELERGSLEDSLLLLPVGGWTTLADLSELSGMSERQLEPWLATLAVDLADRIHTNDAPSGGEGVHYTSEKLASLLAEGGDVT